MSRINKRIATALMLAFFCLLACGTNKAPTAPANSSPSVPSDPSPFDGGQVSVGCGCIFYLSWNCTDPDAGDSLRYDVYYGPTQIPPLAEANLASARFLPAVADTNTTYYWKVVARDRSGASTAGPVWWFKATP